MTTEDLRQKAERKLDETLEETFPASDAPANTVETGIVARDLPSPLPTDVMVNHDRSRFEMFVEGQTPFLSYTTGLNTLTLVHTEVPETLRGQGLGTALVKAAVESARARGLRVIAQCAFAKAYLRKHATRS
jgi:predicted GNAT family acetyltransferase